MPHLWTILSVNKEEIDMPPGLIAGMDEEEEMIEVTVDSGAVDTVGPPSAGKAFETYETEASRTGKNFKAANGSPIENYGETDHRGYGGMAGQFKCG